MIVVDTSALMAFIVEEPEGPSCRAVLQSERQILISAVTLTEAMIVATRRNLEDEMKDLIRSSVTRIIPLTRARAWKAAAAYARWGKGIHPAALNFGDCFAYALAMERGDKLLFKGEDFVHAGFTRLV